MARVSRAVPGQRTDFTFGFLMAIMILSWALAFPFIKIGLESLSPVNLTIMRFVVVCSTLLVLLLVQPYKFSRLEKRDVPMIFILGFFGVMVYHLCLNYGEQYISPGAASLIVATIPLFVLLLATVFLGEKLTPKRILGVSLALVGVIIISLWGKPDLSIAVTNVLGAVAVVIAALMGAFYTVAGKKMLQGYSALSLTTYAMLLGSLGLLPFLTPSLATEVTAMPLAGWGSILFLGICSTVMGYLLWYVALKVKDATEVSVYLYCIPIVTILIDLFFFHEGITPLFLLGGFFILAGLLLTRSKQQNT